MRFGMPRTLLWRTFALIALLLGLSMFAWFQIYSHYGQKLRARQAAQLVVSIVNLTRSALLASDATQRITLLRELSSQEGIHVYPAEPEDLISPLDNSDMTRAIVSELQLKLGQSTRLAAEYAGQPGFFVSFRLDPEIADDEYWVMLPHERVFRAAAASWLGWGIAAILLSLAGAYLIVFSVTRPLKALEQAARAIGRGDTNVSLPEQGAQEFATVAQAFNQMSSDLSQLESDRALILAGISHDLKTPLARLRLGIEMSGAGSEDIEAMAADIDEMDRIIRQFLDFARDIDSEEKSACDLQAIAESVQASFNRKASRVIIHPAQGNTRHAGVRPLALRRALGNLVDNALRYGNPEQAVEISLTRQNKMLDIQVADRGPGIPADQTERLKRPFTRLEVARSNVGGSGLGLAIVERIVRVHGGELLLLPREGGGLNAILRLPV